MTIGQYLVSFCSAAIVIIVGLLLAARRSPAILFVSAIGFTIAAAAFFALRPRSNGPYALKSALISAAAIAIATAVVYARRGRQHASGLAVTGILAFFALGFTWFETAYLFR